MFLRYPKKGGRRGFTLIEILMVLLIIGLLAAFTVPNFIGKKEEAMVTAAKAEIEANFASALDMYHLDNSRYPTTEQGLRALIEAPSTAPVPKKWKGPYLKKKRIAKDPWGNDYIYTSPGTHNTDDYDLSSYGQDGVESEDDIVNWEEDQGK